MNSPIQHIQSWLGNGSLNIFGVPFAGKDTQCEILQDILNAELIGGGEILRAQKDNEALQNIMATGALIPTDMYFDIVLPYLSRPEIKQKPLVLSSVGRMDGEQETIVNAAEASGHPLKAVVLLSVPESVARARYETSTRGQRADDAGDVLTTRFDEFNRRTRPVIEFYRAKGILVEVNGTKTPAEVTSEILDQLSRLATRP